MFADHSVRFIRVVRDIDFGGVTRLGAGAVRIVSADDFATNAWDANGPCGTALFVPVDVTRPDAGRIALDPDDYEVLPVPLDPDVAIQAF